MRVGCRVATLVLVSLTLSAVAVASQPAPWDTIKVTGGTAAFRCAVGLPARIPRARLLVEIGRRVADTGSDDPVPVRLAAYASWIANLDVRMAALGGSALTIDDTANRKNIDDILDDLGIVVRRRGGTATAEPRPHPDANVERFTTCLTGSRDDLARRLSAHERVVILPPPDDVPLPVTAAAWTALGKGDAPQRLFLSIIGDRDAMVLYAALASLDGETAAFLAQPSVWRQMNGAERTLAAYGSAIRIRGGAVDVPGGAGFGPSWEKLVNKARGEPAEFIRTVLRADDGRLAYFYATLDAFDAVKLKALLTRDRDGPKRLYGLFKDLSTWVPAQRPLSGPGFDMLSAAADIAVDSDGSPIGPRARPFWRSAFEYDELPDRPERLLRDKDSEGATVVWLLEQVFAKPAQARERLAMIAFAQRVFPTPDVSPAKLVAAIACKRFPALALGLERMGIRDPQLYANLARRADRLMLGDAAVVTTRLRQWQGAVGLVEALRRTGAIDVAQASSSLEAIAAWEPRRNGAFTIPLAGWFESTIGPLLPASTSEPDPSIPGEDERRLYLLISGPIGRPADSVTWEGLTYRVDLASAHARRAAAIARLEPRPSLDDLLALTKAAAVLEHAAHAAEVATVAADLQARLPQFKSNVPAAPWAKRQEPTQPGEVLKRVLKDLGRVRKDSDARRAQRVAPTLWWLADELFADVLPAVLYTGRLGAAVGPPEKYADLWRRHDLGLGATLQSERERSPWKVPDEDVRPAGGVRVAGSLIGFDLALGRLLLRRVGGGTPPAGVEVPVLLGASIDRVVALQASAAAGAGDELRAVADQMARGRQQWAALVAAPESSPAHWPDALRLNLVAWMKSHESAAIDGEVSLTELVAIGTGASDVRQASTLFGLPSGGCWCLRFPAPAALFSQGQWAMPSAGGDLPLRVAEILAELRMPAVLLPAVAAGGFADLIDRIDAVHPADWHAVTDEVRLLPRDRLEQLVFSLVATRELTIAAPAGRIP